MRRIHRNQQRDHRHPGRDGGGRPGEEGVPRSAWPPTGADLAEGTATPRAACGYWQRRGLPTRPEQVVAAPGAPLLLLALLAAEASEAAGASEAARAAGAAGAAAGAGATGATGPAGTARGAVLLPHPGAEWHAPQVRLLGRPLLPVPVPAECGGVPDPFALLEAVRRARAGGGDPRLLLLSVADDATGTAAPPELLHEVCEAAAGEGLLIASDESWRDTSHDPHDTVIVSPAEMLGADHADSVVVLAGLDPALLPSGTRAGIARFPDTEHGRALAEAAREVLRTLHTELSGPADAAAAEALSEPGPLRERRAAVARFHGRLATALHGAFTEAGAVCRPPHVGRHLYADLEALRPQLARRGIKDALGLEAELVRRLGPQVSGGHRFGDDPRELRVRVSTGLLATDPPGSGSASGSGAGPDAADPLREPRTARALASVRTALGELAGPGTG